VILQAEPEAALGRRHPGPPPVRAEHPRVGLVAERVVEHTDQPATDRRVLDGDHHLDPPVEVALHQVG
jgi:hypothetical protein